MNLFELFVKIGVDDQASGHIGGIAEKLGNGLKTAAKVGTAAVGAAAAGITALTSAAVQNYAEYEQLVGGVDTLFKESSQKLQDYAANAYQTAGMSANDYMENVTAFSATLINSLGGDTEQAVEYANRAMVAMSDNANKMGTDMESIVQTYQSLSRGNFAMLDNLKLGYGGTKAELERLIADAATYTDIQREMGIVVDASSMSFDNIVNAITVVQGHLGIAGATAQEAATTIEGSVKAMSASWQNLVTGMANENANFEQLVSNFVQSASNVVDNFLPRVQVALNGVADLITQILPVIMEKIPVIIQETLPKIAEAAVGVVEALVRGISDNQQMLISTIYDVVMVLVTSFINLLPEIVALGLQVIVSIVNGIAENIPELIPVIVDVILQIVDTLTDPTNLSMLIDAAIAIMLALADGLIEAIPRLIEAVPEIIENLITAIVKNAPKLLAAGVELIVAIGKGMIEAIPQLLKAIPEILSAIIQGIGNGVSMIIDIGKDIVRGLWEGIQAMGSWIKDKVSNFFSGIVSGVKNFLGISSPSKVFASIGGFMAEGLGEGWDKEFAHVKRDIDSSLDFNGSGLGISGSIKTATAGYSGAAGGFGGTTFSGLTININGANYSDENSLAEAIAERLQRMTERRAAVYGLA